MLEGEYNQQREYKLYRQEFYTFANRRWRAEDLRPFRPDVDRGRVLLPVVPEEPSLLGADYVRACKAAAAKSGACHPAPWQDYATGRERGDGAGPCTRQKGGRRRCH